jgi:lysine/ornithine N-monooxygenase
MRTEEITTEDYKRKLTLTLNHAEVKSLINLLNDTYAGMTGYHNIKEYFIEELENNIEFEEMCDEVDDEYLQGLIDEDTYQQLPAYQRLMRNSDLSYE